MNILNEQFQSVFTKEPPGELPRLGASPYKQIGQLIITKEGVEKLLSELKPNKAPGPDGIPPWFLKEGEPYLCSKLPSCLTHYSGLQGFGAYCTQPCDETFGETTYLN